MQDNDSCITKVKNYLFVFSIRNFELKLSQKAEQELHKKKNILISSTNNYKYV